MTRLIQLTWITSLVLLAVPVVVAAGPAAVAHPGSHVLVEVTARDKAQWAEIMRSELDVWETGNMRITICVAPEINDRLRSRGFATRVLDADIYTDDSGRSLPAGGFPAEYLSYADMAAALTSYAATYPSIASMSSLGTSLEGRDVWALKISDNVGTDEAEPEVLVTGAHHPREVITPIVNVALAESLLVNYGSDPTYTDWVDELEIWIVPVVNPDGYVYVETTDPGWRKTRSFNGDGSRGVDPNRNYDYEWGHDDNGSSPFGVHDTYRGPFAFSEPCTQAMRDFVNAHEFVFALNFHSHGETLLWGPGWKPGVDPENDLYVGYGSIVTAANGYFPGSPGTRATTVTNGDANDWLHLGAGHAPVYAMTPEVGTSFMPMPAQIPGEVIDGLATVWPAFDHAARPGQLAPPGQPTLNALPVDTDGSYTVTWDPPTTADTQVAMYEIVEKTDPSVVTDGIEAGTGAFSLGGWVESSARAASGSFSLYSGDADSLNNILWASEPYVVQLGDAFTFDAWYSIESEWDYAYAILSTDGGRSFVNLPGTNTTMSDPNGNNADNGITGSSGGFIPMSFDLSPWVGQSVQLGLRYFTDESTTGEGLYADNLHPVQAWGSVTSLSSTTIPTSFAVAGRTDGTYTYAVRGQDAEGDWGYWSSGLDVTVNLSGTGIQSSAGRLSFSLSDASPNPFAGPTSIRFTLPEPADHSLVVFDVAGRRVRGLSSGRGEAGVHVVTWGGRSDDGRPVPSGVYFTVLRANGRVLHSRAVLQR